MKNTVVFVPMDRTKILNPMHPLRIRLVLGVALLPLLLILMLPSATWAKTVESVVHSFTGGSDGSTPIGILTLDKAGNLYGVAAGGGASQNGVVFELTRGPGGHWTETELYSFAGGNDGAGPVGGVIFDKAGNLYGVTQGGGGNGCFGGCGTVFELTPGANGQWTEAVLYAFTGGSDGGSPTANLIFDAAGNLYGTTEAGGNASCGGCGTVFKLTPRQNGHWTETVLHAFKGHSDGALPLFAGVIFDGAGNLYGTTLSGGKYDNGTVFELAPAKAGRWKKTILHAFKGGSDGASPAAGLVLVGGILYGTTYNGGDESAGCPSAGCGTVFQLSAKGGGKWTETVIHRFQGSDGIESLATPIFDKAGNLYGTTFEGGSGNCGVCGTAFELTPVNGQWQETVLHDFGSRNGDAGTPEGGLIVNKAGKLFGTTAIGGNNGVGSVYEITP